MVNHMKGVNWDDPYRYELIKEGEDQSISQTKNITSYTFHPDFSQLQDTITIIDTPGFADTDGIEEDKKVFKKVHDFFQLSEGFSIKKVHLAAIVVPISRVRLDATEKYIYNEILSLFGNDVGNNIVLLLTHMEPREPKQVLKAAKIAGIPVSVWYGFNNGYLFEEIPEDEADRSLLCNVWSRCQEQCRLLFSDLESSKWSPVSLELTKDVLARRLSLEDSMRMMDQRISQGISILVFLNVKVYLTLRF